MRFRVKLTAIVWDDGKGEYDVSALPTSALVSCEGVSSQAAIEHAMDELGDYYGSLIEGATAHATEE